VSHSRTVPSSLPLATSCPSAESATVQTRPLCPRNVPSSRPPFTSHSRTVPSWLPLASSAPLALRASPRTPPVWPYSVVNSRPPLGGAAEERPTPALRPAHNSAASPSAKGGSHKCTVPSSPPLASSRQSALSATPSTPLV